MGNRIRLSQSKISHLWLLFACGICVSLVFALGAPLERAAARVAPNLAEQLCTVIDHQITSNGSHIVFSSYQGDYTDRNQGGIYSIPSDGGTIEKLNNAATDNTLNSSFLLTPDGSQTIYAAGETLYVAPVAGGQSVELASGIASLDAVELAGDGQTIVYLADTNDDAKDELYSVPTQGGQPVMLGNGDDVTYFALATDANTVLYRDGGIYATPIGGGDVVTLTDSAELTPHDITLADDGQTLLYIATVAGVETLISTQIDGSSHQTLANLSDSQLIQSAISPNGKHAFYLAQSNGINELYAVNLNTLAVTKLNGNLVSGGSVVDMPIAVSPDSSFVVYLANQDSGDTVELYQASVAGDAVIKLNAPLVAGGNVGGDNNLLRISPDSAQVLYVADQEEDEKQALYSVALTTGAVTTLSPTLERTGRVTRIASNGASLLITPDSRFVIFALRPSATSAEIQLHSASLSTGWLTQLNDEADPSGLVPVLTLPTLSPDGTRVVYLDAYGPDADTILRYSLRSETPTGASPIELVECTVGVSLANHMIIVDQASLRDYDWSARRSVASEIALDGHATYARVGARLLVSDPSTTYSYSWPLLQLEQQNATSGRGFIRFIDDEKLLLIDDASLNNVAWPDFVVQSSAESQGRPNYHFVGDRILLLDGSSIKQFFWPGLQPDGHMPTAGQPSVQFISAERMLVNDQSQLRYVSWPTLETLATLPTDGQSTLQFLSANEVLISDNSSLRQVAWPSLELLNSIATDGPPDYRFSDSQLFISDSSHIRVYDWPSLDNAKSVAVGSAPEVTFVESDTLLVTSDQSVQTFSYPELAQLSNIATSSRAENRFIDDDTLLLIDNGSFNVHSWPSMARSGSITTKGHAVARFSGADSLLLLDQDSIRHYTFPALTERNSVATDGQAEMQFITSEMLILQDDDSITHYAWPAFTALPTIIDTVGESSYERIADRLLVADAQSLRIFSYAALTLDLSHTTVSVPAFQIVNNQLVVLDGATLTIFDWETLNQLDQKATDGPASVCIYAPIANCLDAPDQFAPTFPSSHAETGSALIGPANGAITLERKPSLDWLAASDVSGLTYEVQLSATLAQGGTFSETVTTEHSIYIPMKPLADGDYSWTVRAIDALGNQSDWQPAEQFTVRRFDIFVPTIVK